MNLGMYIERSARFWPDRPAILFRDQALSYRDLAVRSRSLSDFPTFRPETPSETIGSEPPRPRR